MVVWGFFGFGFGLFTLVLALGIGLKLPGLCNKQCATLSPLRGPWCILSIGLKVSFLNLSLCISKDQLSGYKDGSGLKALADLPEDLSVYPITKFQPAV